jgi:hypothetical protein
VRINQFALYLMVQAGHGIAVSRFWKSVFFALGFQFSRNQPLEFVYDVLFAVIAAVYDIQGFPYLYFTALGIRHIFT